MSGLRSGGGAARDQQGGHGRRKKPSEMEAQVQAVE